MRIGLISDTHGHLDDDIMEALDPCEEIWHAGDVGSMELLDTLEGFKPCRGVFGNIDDHRLRSAWPEEQLFEIKGLKVYMIHIGGYPPKYKTTVRNKIILEQPDLYICGHSHILKIMPDPQRQLLHMNPGACGHHGFHVIRTLIRFSILEGKIKDVEVVELGRRGRI